MFESLETGAGLEFILWLQENRTDWMATLSEIFSQLGYDFGYVALFGLIFWAISKRHGIRLVFALVAVSIVTFALKDFFAYPRPFAVSDAIVPAFEADGFGFPSGHTSLAVMIWGYIAVWARNKWMWVFAITYMALQGFFRMVAGVHYPQDIVGGVIVGVLTLLAFYPLADRWGTFWREQSMAVQIGISLIVPIVSAVVLILFPLQPFQVEAYLTILGLMAGVGIGAAIEPRYINFEAHPDMIRRVIQFVLGGVVVVLFLLGLSPVFDAIADDGTVLAYILRVIRYGIAGFAAIAIVPYLSVQLNLMNTKQTESDATPATV